LLVNEDIVTAKHSTAKHNTAKHNTAKPPKPHSAFLKQSKSKPCLDLRLAKITEQGGVIN